MQSDIEKGRVKLMIVLASIIGLTVLSSFAVVLQGGDVRIPDIIRLGLTVALSFAVWTGQKWARTLMGVLLIIGGLFSAIAVSFALGALPSLSHSFAPVLLAVSALAWLVGGIFLLASRDIDAFLRSYDTPMG
jgi:hypothetical protein